MTWGMAASPMDDGALTAGSHRATDDDVTHRACLTVASAATGVEDCRELLAMLGLTYTPHRSSRQVSARRRSRARRAQQKKAGAA